LSRRPLASDWFVCHRAGTPAPTPVAGATENLIQGGSSMGICEVCGNDYDKAMEVVVSGESHVFDGFECAIHTLAPRCEHCECTIVGHGVESGGAFYCCAHCAHAAGVQEAVDRV
jgi:hypothetical protein